VAIMGPAAFSNCNHYPARVLRISVLSTTRMATVVVHVCRPDRAWPPCCDRRRCHHVRLHARKLSWLDRTSRGSRDPGDHTRRYVWRDKACAIKGCLRRKLRRVVLSDVLPSKTSYTSGKPSGVMISPMTTWTQSERLSRL